LTFCPASCVMSTTALMSSRTRCQSPESTAEMLQTMSNSVPPSASACLASATLTAVVCPPWGKPIVVLGISKRGIDFDAPDGQLSTLICLILTPTDQPETQIEMLAVIAQTFERSQVRQRCLAANSATELRAVLNQASSEHSDELALHDEETLGMT